MIFVTPIGFLRAHLSGADFDWFGHSLERSMQSARQARKFGIDRSIRAARYTPVARWIHWLMALLIAVQYVVAWSMPEIGRGTQPGSLINLHLSIGALILILASLRLVWRLGHEPPTLPDRVPTWQRWAARANHCLLYFLIFILPVLGWANASARGWPVRLFGILRLPVLSTDLDALGRAAGDIHANLALVLLALIAVHVAATFYHQAILRDGLVRRILP